MSASRSFHYSAGSAQEFKEVGFTIRPAEFGEELTYDPENEHMSFPVVILMETDTPQGRAHARHQAYVPVTSFSYCFVFLMVQWFVPFSLLIDVA